MQIVLTLTDLKDTLLYSFVAREKDRVNQQEYKEHLKGIKKRVESRPLLLEQASQSSVSEAKANYIAALRKVGFSEQEIETLLKDVAENSAK